jgi:hypothetical protein
MISRRNFVWCGALALIPLPTPLLTTDPYDQFLDAVRERLIVLAPDGHVVERLLISPPRNGRRAVYAWCEGASEPITFTLNYDVR